MGTRNLTVIIKDNTVKLSQYGQWDGYFSCTGVKFLNFVNENLIDRKHGKGRKLKTTVRLDEFKQVVDNLISATPEYLDKVDKAYKEMSNIDGAIIPFSIMFPQFCRDTGVEILDILNNVRYEIRSNKFAVVVDTDIMCIQYINVIDLDKDSIYMLTTDSFNTDAEIEVSNEIVNRLFVNKGFACYYTSKISEVGTVKEVSKHVKEIGLN